MKFSTKMVLLAFVAVVPVTAMAANERGGEVKPNATSSNPAKQDDPRDRFVNTAVQVMCLQDKFNAEPLLLFLDEFLDGTLNTLKIAESRLADLNKRFRHDVGGSLTTDSPDETVIATRMVTTEGQIHDVKSVADHHKKLTAETRLVLEETKSPDALFILEKTLSISCETSVRWSIESLRHSEYLRLSVEKLHRDLDALRMKTSR